MPRKLGIRYAAAARFYHGYLWNTGSRAGAGEDAECIPPIYQRHCEEQSDEAIHSSFARRDGLPRCARNDDANYTCAFPRRFTSELCKISRHRKIRGRGECRVRAAPAVSCAKCTKETHTSIQVQRKHSGIPCAMVLRLMARSSRRRIRSCHRRCRLDGWNRIRSDRSRHRQLDTSNGCRNHTLLPYALAPSSRALLSTHGKTALRTNCAPTLPRPPHPSPRS